MPPLRRSLWLRRRCRPRHTSVCARRAAFARAPSSPLRLVRPLAPAGADGGAVGAQKAARPSRRVRCAPPCCRLRPSFVGSGGGWSLGGALAIKKGANVARVPSLPARRRARARVRLRGKQRWGGACSPLRAAAPPPLLRPRPPLSVGGGGCGFHASAAAGAKKTAPCGAVLKETQYMVLALLDGSLLLAFPLGVAERAGQSAYAARRVQGAVVAKVQHRNILTQ